MNAVRDPPQLFRSIADENKCLWAAPQFASKPDCQVAKTECGGLR